MKGRRRRWRRLRQQRAATAASVIFKSAVYQVRCRLFLFFDCVRSYHIMTSRGLEIKGVTAVVPQAAAAAAAAAAVKLRALSLS